MTDFEAWPKTPRLFKEMTVTEKIDGTNAAVVIQPQPFGTGVDIDQLPNIIAVYCPPDDPDVDEAGMPNREYHVYAQSRKRMITPGDDNYGFASWVADNARALVDTLGPGRHFGEWWGNGIQRGYEMLEKRFSLFNTHKWRNIRKHELAPAQLDVVPELYVGPFDTEVVDNFLDDLELGGSKAAPGFMDPEGVCVWHSASRQVYKALLEGSGPKGGPRDDHGNVVSLPIPSCATEQRKLLQAA